MKFERSVRTFAVLLAFGAAAACDDSPIDVAEEGVETLTVTPTYLPIVAGETRTIDATPYNAAGSVVTANVDFEVCDAKITAVEDSLRPSVLDGTGVLVTGVTLGRSCITVTSGGEEVTVLVRVVPDSLEVSGPALIASGQTGSFDVDFFDTEGEAVTGFDLGEVVFSSADSDIAEVDETGTVQAKAPGTTQIIVELNDTVGGARTDTIDITVEPGVLGVGVTPSTGAAGTEVSLELADTDPVVDSTSSVVATVDGESYPVWLLETLSDPNSGVTRVPYGLEVGSVVTLSLTGLGDGEVALAGDFTVDAEDTNDPAGPRDPFLGEDPTVITSLPFEEIGAIDGENGEENDGFFYIPAADDSVDILLDWDDAHGSTDLDVLVFQNGVTYAACQGQLATGAHPQHGVCALTAGNEYYFVVNDYNATDATTNYYLRIMSIIEEDEGE